MLFKGPENEKEVIIGTASRGGEDEDEDGEEEEKKEHGESCKSPVGGHSCTKAEAFDFLADLTDYPNFVNWLSGEAREEEASRLRRIDGKKRKRLEFQVAEVVQGSNHLPTDADLESKGAQRSNHLQMDAVLASEDAGVEKQKVVEGAQVSAFLGKDAIMETEQQHYINDARKGKSGKASSFGERTEPTAYGNTLEESALVIHLCSSSAEEAEAMAATTVQGVKMKAVKDDFFDIIEKEDQADTDAELERTASLEAHADRLDVIPVELLEEQAKKNAELQRKMLPRYFDQKSSQQRSRSSEDNDAASDCSNRTKKKKKKKKKQKVCCICGRIGHLRNRCYKVNKCIFCSKKGHLCKDCPDDDIVVEHTSKFCLRCANSGHDMFSCPNDYSPDDLEKIQCYVCRAFGHLCCANYGNEDARSISCYNCGESDHLGPECKKLPQKSSAPKHQKCGKKRNRLHEKGSELNLALVHANTGEKVHLQEECNKLRIFPEAIISRVPKLAKLPVPKNYVSRFQPPYSSGNGPHNYVPRFNPPHGFGNSPQNYVRRFGYGPQNYTQRFNPPHRYGNGPPFTGKNEMINGQESWPQWNNKSHFLEQGDPMFVCHLLQQLKETLSSSNSSGQSTVQPQQ